MPRYYLVMSNVADSWIEIATRLQADAGGFIRLAEAAKILRATLSAANRWINHGKDGARLEAVWVGRGWMTTREAVTRFMAETSRKMSGRDAPFDNVRPRENSPLERERRARAAVDELERLMGRKGRRAG